MLSHTSFFLRLFALFAVLLQLVACAHTELGAAERKRIAGQTYVVTGASSGIGRGIAEQLGALGANVVVAARKTDALEEVAEVVRRAGGSALVVTTDVSRREDVMRLAQAAVARFGRIDVWINNAGVGALGCFEAIPAEDHARVIEVNVNGVIYGSHAALKQFKAQGHGRLINISSILGQIPVPYQGSYVASKAAVLALGRALNQELRLAGAERIGVTTVLPWAVDTPFFQQTANYTGRVPRSVAYDDARAVAAAIVWVSIHTRDEFPVGWKAAAVYTGHNLVPALTERIAAQVEHRTQMESGAPAPPTSGNLHRPLPGVRSVDGGMRERMTRDAAVQKRDDAAQAATPGPDRSGLGMTLAAGGQAVSRPEKVAGGHGGPESPLPEGELRCK